jgi:hypothetical protein
MFAARACPEADGLDAGIENFAYNLIEIHRKLPESLGRDNWGVIDNDRYLPTPSGVS